MSAHVATNVDQVAWMLHPPTDETEPDPHLACRILTLSKSCHPHACTWCEAFCTTPQISSDRQIGMDLI